MSFLARIVGSACALVIASVAFAGGNTWTQVGPEGGNVRKVLMHRTNADIAFALSAGGLYRTTNGGASWSLVVGEFQYAPYALLDDPSDPNRFYILGFNTSRIQVSVDGGATFQPLQNLPDAAEPEPRLGVGSNGVLYFSSGLRVFRSENRGGVWTERSSLGLPADARVSALVVDSIDADTLYALSYAGASAATMFVSRDGATTWTRLADYDTSRSIGALAAHPTVSGQLWAARRDGLWRSDDFGASFRHVGFAHAIDVAIDATQSGVLYALTRDPYARVHRSLDEGESWSDITGDLRTGAQSIAIDPLDGNRLMIAGESGVSTATAAGGVWTGRNAGILATHVGNLESDASADRLYAHTGLGDVFASDAGGRFTAVNNDRWSTISTLPPPNAASVIHAQPNALLAVLSYEIARSSDGGATWTLIPGYPTERQDQIWLLESSRADPLNLIVAGTQSMFRSSNGGANWTRITNGLPPGFSTSRVAFSNSNAAVVYVAPFISSVASQFFGVYRSADGGTHWAPANAGIETAVIYDLEVDPSDSQVVYAIADNFLRKTTDGGASWNALLPAPAYGQIAIDPADPRIVYMIGGENSVVRSVNGGASFQVIRDTSHVPWWQPRSVLVDPSRPSVLNVGTAGFGVQQMSFEPDLELTSGAPPTSVPVGAPAGLRFFVANKGPFAASGARVTFQLPSGALGSSASTQAGECTTVQLTIECSLRSIERNAAIAVDLTVQSQAAGPFPISAALQGDQPDPNASNNSVSYTVEIGSAPSAPPSGGASSSKGGGGSTSPFWILAALILLWARSPRARLV